MNTQDVVPGTQLIEPNANAVQAPPALALPEGPGIDRLIALAIQHGESVEPLERLMTMRRELKAEAAREAFFEALSAFQADCPVIPKRKSVGEGNWSYRYAPLEDIIRAVSPLLREHGLSYRFDTAFEADPPAQVVTCIVHHRDGHQEQSEFRTPIDARGSMNVMQKSASAQTYAKRYAFCNAFGILTGDEDNDGRGEDGGGISSSASRERPEVRPAPSSSSASSSVVRGRAGESATAPQPRATGKLVRLVRETQGSDGTALPRGGVQQTAVAETPASPKPDGLVAQALRDDLVEMAMDVELQERISRGQEPPAGEVLEPIARDRCDAVLTRLYDKKLETATLSELEALKRIVARNLQKLNEGAAG